MKLSDEQFGVLKSILSEGDDFVRLVRIAGLDPSCDFLNANLAGVDFGCADLSGYNFSGADLRGADISRANVSKLIIGEGVSPENKKEMEAQNIEFILRPYQVEAIRAIESALLHSRKVHAVMARNTGKSMVACHLMRRMYAAGQCKFLLLCNSIIQRDQLVWAVRKTIGGGARVEVARQASGGEAVLVDTIHYVAKHAASIECIYESDVVIFYDIDSSSPTFINGLMGHLQDHVAVIGFSGGEKGRGADGDEKWSASVSVFGHPIFEYSNKSAVMDGFKIVSRIEQRGFVNDNVVFLSGGEQYSLIEWACRDIIDIFMGRASAENCVIVCDDKTSAYRIYKVFEYLMSEYGRDLCELMVCTDIDMLSGSGVHDNASPRRRICVVTSKMLCYADLAGFQIAAVFARKISRFAVDALLYRRVAGMNKGDNVVFDYGSGLRSHADMFSE